MLNDRENNSVKTTATLTWKKIHVKFRKEFNYIETFKKSKVNDIENGKYIVKNGIFISFIKIIIMIKS